MTRIAASPNNISTLARRLIVTANVSGVAIQIGVIASVWGRWTLIATVSAIVMVAIVGNLVITRFGQRVAPDRREDIRAAFNVLVHAAIGILCDWTLASWLFVPFVVTMSSIPPATHAARRMTLVLIAMNAIALGTGARLADALVVTGISVFLHVMVAAYLDLANNLIRDRESALEELQAAQQVARSQEKLASIGQLAAGIAHEINNPMCFITTNVEMLLEDLRAEPHISPVLVEHRDAIAVETLEGIVRVNSIVGDLRRFASGEPAQWAEFDLSVEVASALRIARTQLAPGQQLHAEVPPAIVTSGVARQIGQVVLNLVMNASQAIDDRGQVWARVAATDDAIEITVTDDGIGMRRETIARVFEPFFTTRSAGDGVGLGLSVVHGIVHSHGGRIEVTSEPGSGSTFTLWLPRHQLHPHVVPDVAASRATALSSPGSRSACSSGGMPVHQGVKYPP